MRSFWADLIITDKILLSSEAFHFMKYNQAKKRGYMALKLVMSKAYDRIEWDNICSMLLQMGFQTQWVDRICVTSVSYSILINGQPTDRLIPQRGLRQRDPLFPVSLPDLC